MRADSSLAALGAGLAVALAGCAGVADQAAMLAAARAEALVAVPAGAGIIFPGDEETFSWQGQGELLVTPTALVMDMSPRQHVIPYATVTGTSVRSVKEWVPIGRNRVVEQLLVVETSRPTCGRGCVFRIGDPAMRERVADLVESQRHTVDPFGRRDAGRQAWLATGLRNARAFWRVEPAYLQHSAPDRRKAVEEWFRRATGGGEERTTGPMYGAALTTAMLREPAAGYSFRPLPGVEVNHRSELSISALAKALENADPEVDRLLVSDVDRIELVEAVSADYVVSIEATFRAFVDYFDIDPLKDGHYFFARHTVSRPLDEWLAMDIAGFEAELAALAEQVLRCIHEELAAGHGKGLECPGDPAGAEPHGRKPQQGE